MSRTNYLKIPDLHLFNGAFAINKKHKLTGFAYILDFDTAAALSTSTYGMRYSGDFDVVSILASYATQSDKGNNANNFSINFFDTSTCLPRIIAFKLTHLVCCAFLCGCADHAAKMAW